KQMLIDWRKHNWLGAQHPEIVCLHRHRQNSLGLTGSSIELRQFATDDDVGIKWIGDNVAVFLGGDWLPVAKRDLAIVATTCDSNRAALLLTAVKTIRKRVVRADMIKLRRGLIIPRAPGRSPIHRDNRALVRAEKNDVRVVWIDPNVLIIVAAGRT